MTTAEEMFAAPVTFNGQEFPRLLMKDYGALESDVRTNRRAVYVALLAEANITSPAERFVALRDALAKDVQPFDVDDYLRTRSGVERALKLSLVSAGKTDTEATGIVGKLPFPMASLLARQCAGFAPVDVEKPKDAKNPSEDTPPLQ